MPNKFSHIPFSTSHGCPLVYLFLLILVLNGVVSYAQQESYHVSFKKDAPIIGVGIGLSTLGIILGNNADKASIAEINNFDPSMLSAFDRGAASNFSSTAQTISDVILYTGATLPFITYFSHKCRIEGADVGIMAIETFLITNGLTNITKSLAKRYRPYNYNPEVPIEVKLSGGSRLSFFSGHASNTAAMSFLAAQVYTDLHPDADNKYLIWTVAATVPAVISYLRYEAGKHFPTDLITGYVVGASIGLLIPKIHMSENASLLLGGHGVNFSMKF